MEEEATIDVINRISPKRLIEGGAAMLHAENRNHQKVMWGNIIMIPLVI